MTQDSKLKRLLRECRDLVQRESDALEAEDMELLSSLITQKDVAITDLSQLLEDGEASDSDGWLEEQVRTLFDRINENAVKLGGLMEKTDQELALMTRGRNRLKGLRHSYVTVPREGFLDRSNHFEA